MKRFACLKGGSFHGGELIRPNALECEKPNKQPKPILTELRIDA